MLPRAEREAKLSGSAGASPLPILLPALPIKLMSCICTVCVVPVE